MAKIKNNRASFPQSAVRVISAAILLLGALILGVSGLVFTDEFFESENAAEIFDNGITGILTSQADPVSLITGIAVFIAVSLVFCLILKIASGESSGTFGGRIKTAVWCAVIAFGLRCAALLAWNMPPVSDFKSTYELSELLTTIPIGYWGRFLHELGTEYTGVWSAHMPFILYQAMLIKWGISPGLMNAFYGTAACVFTALISKELFGNRAFATAFMFAAVNPLAVLYTSVLSNQHFAAAALAAAVWVVIRYRNYIGAAAGGALLAAGQILRPEMAPALIGIIIFYIISRIKGSRRAGMRAAIFTAVFGAAVIVCDASMRGAGLISGHIYSGNLAYKLCMGLNAETRGMWSEADALLLGDNELLAETLRQRLADPGVLFLMLQKAVFQFGSYVYNWIMDTAAHPVFSHIICRRAVSAYMIIISAVAAVRMLRDKENRLFPVCIVLFGYMAAYALIEMQPRYNFIMIPLLTAAASDIQMTDNKKRAYSGRR